MTCSAWVAGYFMDSVVYAIVFKGEVLDGFQIISVKAHLAKILKIDANKMSALFSGKQVVIKRTKDKNEAVKYGSALRKVGADIKVRIVKSDAPPAPVAKAIPTANKLIPTAAATAQPIPTATPAAAGSEFTLAPNEGNLFDPAPEVKAPNIDSGDIELSNDTGPLAPAKEEERLDVDLTEYSIAAAGEGTLAAPEPEAAKLDAPDFGLDEPGALLETLKEEVEELNLDTSGLSVAVSGSDLLDPEDRDQAPPPHAPDTSGINLVPDVGLSN